MVRGRCAARSAIDMGLFVKNEVQQGLVNLNMAVIADEAQLPEPVHEEADARAGGPNHLGQGFLADLGDDRFWLSFIAIIRQEQQQPCKPPFAGIEQLVDQVGFDPDGAIRIWVMNICENAGWSWTMRIIVGFSIHSTTASVIAVTVTKRCN